MLDKPSVKQDVKALKILFLDDDPFILDMYGTKFAQTNHDVRFASTADDAIKILKEGFQPDAIVFDLIMPGTQGFDFVAQIKEESLVGGTALIALTNQNEIEDYDRAEALHVDEYIVKANHIPSEVVAIIENTVKNKQNNTN